MLYIELMKYVDMNKTSTKLKTSFCISRIYEKNGLLQRSHNVRRRGKDKERVRVLELEGVYFVIIDFDALSEGI